MSAVGLGAVLCFGNPVSAEEISTHSTAQITMEKVSPYVFQTTYTSSPTDLSKGIFENKTIIEYDFTDAKFLDKNQNEVDKELVHLVVHGRVGQVTQYVME